jgi:proto-oncogene tyrosine-protein kinase Ret
LQCFQYILAQKALFFQTTTQSASLDKMIFATSQQPDPKWEFPRSRLFTDEILNEGEFGRVLRAHALDIGGVPGE